MKLGLLGTGSICKKGKRLLMARDQLTSNCFVDQLLPCVTGTERILRKGGISFVLIYG